MRSRSFCLPACLASTFLLTATLAHAATWTPPVGIPSPSFGINEVAPATPNPWTTATAGFYYIDATKAAATDTANPYGTPAKPRQTIPWTLPAGSVVELHGTYDTAHSSPATIVAQGTVSQPVWIRGVSPTSRPLVRRSWEVKGTYAVIENLEFGPMPDLSDTGSLVILLPASHVVLRNSDLHGTKALGGGLGVLNWEVPYGEVYTGPGDVNNVVIYNNTIHDNGDVNATFDQDDHGITVSDHVNHLWVVDNQLYRNSGDGIQINAAIVENQASLHHIYVGRNVSHDNKQTGYWVKQATDVIFSQNESYNHKAGNSSMGQCIGGQYAPDYVWFLFNKLHDCEYGIAVMSDNGETSHMYAIGNVIYNIHRIVLTNSADDPWGPSGIMFAGGNERHFVNNTIWNVDSGINIATYVGSVDMTNNIIGNLTLAGASHLIIGLPALAAHTTISNDLLFGTPRIDFGSGQTIITAAQLASWKSLSSDPQFVNAAVNDFHLTSTSPALGKGTTNTAYTTYQQRYGISIATDFEGTPRPATAYALGAYERACVAAAPAAPQSLTGSSTPTAISLQWLASPAGCSSAPSYILEIGSAPGQSNLSSTSVGNVTAVNIPAANVPPGSYYFRVRATNPVGTSPASNEVAIQYGAPGAPTAFAASIASSKLTLTWKAPAGGAMVAGYIVDIGSAPGLSDRGSFSFPASSTTIVGAAPPRGTYYMRVRAQNSAGASAPSNEIKLVAP